MNLNTDLNLLSNSVLPYVKLIKYYLRAELAPAALAKKILFLRRVKEKEFIFCKLRDIGYADLSNNVLL